jgi:hypothetical protein
VLISVLATLQGLVHTWNTRCAAPDMVQHVQRHRGRESYEFFTVYYWFSYDSGLADGYYQFTPMESAYSEYATSRSGAERLRVGSALSTVPPRTFMRVVDIE